MTKEEFIEKRGLEAYEKRKAQAREWGRTHKDRRKENVKRFYERKAGEEGIVPSNKSYYKDDITYNYSPSILKISKKLDYIPTDDRTRGMRHSIANLLCSPDFILAQDTAAYGCYLSLYIKTDREFHSRDSFIEYINTDGTMETLRETIFK